MENEVGNPGPGLGQVQPPITSQSLIFLSEPPVANIEPDGFHLTAFTSPS
jgi:hypothetical protein